MSSASPRTARRSKGAPAPAPRAAGFPHHLVQPPVKGQIRHRKVPEPPSVLSDPALAAPPSPAPQAARWPRLLPQAQPVPRPGPACCHSTALRRRLRQTHQPVKHPVACRTTASAAKGPGWHRAPAPPEPPISRQPWRSGRDRHPPLAARASSVGSTSRTPRPLDIRAQVFWGRKSRPNRHPHDQPVRASRSAACNWSIPMKSISSSAQSGSRWKYHPPTRPAAWLAEILRPVRGIAQLGVRQQRPRPSAASARSRATAGKPVASRVWVSPAHLRARCRTHPHAPPRHTKPRMQDEPRMSSTRRARDRRPPPTSP